MVWSLEEWSRKDMSSKAKVAHPERLRQAAWVSGPAALPPGCITMGKAQDFKNQCPRMAQDGCTFCLWRTRLVIGQPQVPKLASAGLALCPQAGHPLASVSSSKEGDYLSSGSGGMKESKAFICDLGQCRELRRPGGPRPSPTPETGE